jgi:OOP family OmpA-OmpF porin
LEGVNFEFDRAKLLPESYVVLDRVVASLKDLPEIRVEVGGHTDSKGSDEYNRSLSDRRARAVRDYLISKGISASRLESMGYGESDPITSNDTDAGRARNRRVELTKLGD